MADGDGQVVFTVELDDSAFQAGMGKLQAQLTTLSAAILTALTQGAADLTEANAAGSRWVDGLAQGISRNRSATTAAKNIVSNAATSARATGYTGGFGVGQNLVAGIISGANTKGTALNTALSNLVQSALAAAKKAAGISSPSRLFHDEVGQYLALGIQTGFQDTMAQQVLPAITRSVSGSAAAGNAALQTNSLAQLTQGLTPTLELPDPQALSAAAYPRTGSASLQDVSATRAEASTVNITQQITFEAAMQAPDEVARAMRRQAVYGLAAART